MRRLSLLPCSLQGSLFVCSPEASLSIAIHRGQEGRVVAPLQVHVAQFTSVVLRRRAKKAATLTKIFSSAFFRSSASIDERTYRMRATRSDLRQLSRQFQARFGTILTTWTSQPPRPLAPGRTLSEWRHITWETAHCEGSEDWCSSNHRGCVPRQSHDLSAVTFHSTAESDEPIRNHGNCLSQDRDLERNGTEHCSSLLVGR